MISQKEIIKYVRQAGRGCPIIYRKKLTTELLGNVLDFLADNPECTMEDVKGHFGLPERFSDECLLVMDEAERRNILHKAKRIRNIVFLGITMIVLVVAVAASWIVHENSQSVAYYYYEEIYEKN